MPTTGFNRRFLAEDPRALATDGRRALFLGAFGKHPGWDDHIEPDSRFPDLGLRTESLAVAKQVLYVSGIGRAIDLGLWNDTPDAPGRTAFDHWFVWAARGQWICGRLWASTDGKGRSRYPMVLAAHVVGANTRWILTSVFERMAALQAEAKSTPEAPVVVAALDRTRQELRGDLVGVTDSPLPDPGARDAFLRAPGFGSDQVGLLRCLYRLQQCSAPFAPSTFKPREETRPQHIRVTPGPDGITGALEGWLSLTDTYISREAPKLFLAPASGGWIDVILGEPAAEQLACLLQDSTRLSTAAEVPFDLSSEFVTTTRQRLADWREGHLEASKGSSVVGFLTSIFRR